LFDAKTIDALERTFAVAPHQHATPFAQVLDALCQVHTILLIPAVARRQQLDTRG
jgi:hypothetical protein